MATNNSSESKKSCALICSVEYNIRILKFAICPYTLSFIKDNDHCVFHSLNIYTSVLKFCRANLTVVWHILSDRGIPCFHQQFLQAEIASILRKQHLFKLIDVQDFGVITTYDNYYLPTTGQVSCYWQIIDTLYVVTRNLFEFMVY